MWPDSKLRHREVKWRKRHCILSSPAARTRILLHPVSQPFRMEMNEKPHQLPCFWVISTPGRSATTSLMYNSSVTMADTWAISSNESSHICSSPTQQPSIYLLPIDHLLTLPLCSPLPWQSGNNKIVASFKAQKNLLNPTWFLPAGFDQAKEPINPYIRGRV